MADSSSLAAASLTFSILSFVLLAVALVFFLFPDFSKTIRAGLSRTGSVDGAGSTLGMMGAFLGALSPDIALLSGFVSDIMNGTFRYSVTSIIGVISVILHWIIAGLVHGFGSTTAAVTDAAAAVASTIAASTSAAQVLGVGSEPTNPTPPPASSGQGPSRQSRSPWRMGGPRSVSTMSSMPTPAIGPQSILRTAEINPRPVTNSITGPTGTRMTRTTQGRRPARFSEGSGRADEEEDAQTGGQRWEIPEDIRSKFNPCSIRGLGMFDISKSPMGIAALSSVFSVYFLDMTVNSKRPTGDIMLYLFFSGAIYGLNLFAYSKFKCYGDSFGAIAKSTILPMIIGLAAGSSGFAVLQTTFPSYLPLDPKTQGSPAMPGKYAKCSAPNDKDEFVCDAYKDGKRISSTVIED